MIPSKTAPDQSAPPTCAGQCRQLAISPPHQTPMRKILLIFIFLIAGSGFLAACQGKNQPTLAASNPSTGAAAPQPTRGLNRSTIISTAAQVTRPGPVTPPGPGATPSEAAPTPAGSIPLAGTGLSALAISPTRVYWVSKQDPQELFSAPLSNPGGGDLKPVARSRFITGDLGSMPVVVQGGWLVFLDQAFNATNPLWKLRALNLNTGQERLLDSAGGNRLARIYSFSSDGQLAAWIVQDRVLGRSCPEESSIFTADLGTGQVSLVNRSCAATETQWIALQVAGIHLVASAFEQKTGSRNRIFLIALPSHTITPLSDAYPGDEPSYPAASSNWAAWQTGSGATRLVDLQGGPPTLVQGLPDGQPAVAPAMGGVWIAWLPDPSLYIFSIASHQTAFVAAPGGDEKIVLPAIGGGYIAWGRVWLDAAGNTSRSQIEWQRLESP